MFRTKLTLTGLVVAVALLGFSSSRAFAACDAWYAYAVSLTNTEQTTPFVTDTLAPGGNAPDETYRFITDTLAPGGGPSVVSAPASHGFAWGDAGIDALVMGGIALLFFAGRRALERRRVVAA